MLNLNLLGLITFLLTFFGYHGLYFYITDKNPMKTKKGRMEPSIESWLTNSLEEKNHILIVQQLRNLIMAVTFLATTSVLLIGLLINLIGIEEIIEFPSIIPKYYPTWTIIISLSFSLLNSMLSLRYFTAITILIKSSPNQIKKIENKHAIQYLAEKYEAGNREYLLARRGLIYGIVSLSWYFNLWIYIILLISITIWFAVKHDN